VDYQHSNGMPKFRAASQRGKFHAPVLTQRSRSDPNLTFSPWWYRHSNPPSPPFGPPGWGRLNFGVRHLQSRRYPMTWFQSFAKGHHGYPQPEDEYSADLYESVCLRCGIHGAQTGPVRIKVQSKALHSHFIQLNWIFDVFLVRPEVELALLREGIAGISFRDVIVHKSGIPSSELRQMTISTVIPCIETSHLQQVTCMPKNEESGWECPGEKIFPPDAQFCNCIKHHPPAEMALTAGFKAPLADVFQSSEWFGSGGSAYRPTLVSERFKSVIENHGFRGLGFCPVLADGRSAPYSAERFN